MSLDIAVYTALNTAAVSPLLRGWKPEGQALPCTTVRYISENPRNTLNGETNTKNEYIAIDCWAAGLEEAEALRDQVKAAVKASSLKAIRKAIRPLHEPETQTFRFLIEYSVWG